MRQLPKKDSNSFLNIELPNSFPYSQFTLLIPTCLKSVGRFDCKSLLWRQHPCEEIMLVLLIADGHCSKFEQSGVAKKGVEYRPLICTSFRQVL